MKNSQVVPFTGTSGINGKKEKGGGGIGRMSTMTKNGMRQTFTNGIEVTTKVYPSNIIPDKITL